MALIQPPKPRSIIKPPTIGQMLAKVGQARKLQTRTRARPPGMGAGSSSDGGRGGRGMGRFGR